MQRTAFDQTQCPVARSLDRVGEWWSILILRDAFDGLTRFDRFAQGLGITPNTLTRRLKALCGAGLMERRLHQERPARHEYGLTEKGRNIRPVLWTGQIRSRAGHAPGRAGQGVRNPVRGRPA